LQLCCGCLNPYLFKGVCWKHWNQSNFDCKGHGFENTHLYSFRLKRFAHCFSAAHFIVEKDMALEKVELLQCLGATVERVPPASFSDPEHFCNVAQRRAACDPNGWFANQFDNLSNQSAHYESTGPELWTQMDGQIDVLVVAAGTGGLAAGLSRYLKERDAAVSVVLVDPPGSSLFFRVTKGVAFSDKELEVMIESFIFCSSFEEC
jgi:cysteine synthase